MKNYGVIKGIKIENLRNMVRITGEKVFKNIVVTMLTVLLVGASITSAFASEYSLKKIDNFEISENNELNLWDEICSKPNLEDNADFKKEESESKEHSSEENNENLPAKDNKVDIDNSNFKFIKKIKNTEFKKWCMLNMELIKNENMDRYKAYNCFYYENNRTERIEQQKKYNQSHKDQIKKIQKNYYENHKENQIERQKKYYENNVEKRKIYYETNKEIIKLKNTIYGKTHKEQRKKYTKNFYNNNRIKILEQSREYSKTHKEQRKKYYEKYYQENKEKIKERTSAYKKEKRKQKQAEVNAAVEENMYKEDKEIPQN